MTANASKVLPEIVIERVFNAPRELVWEVWTNPQHCTKWWGPLGFSTTTHEMDVRPGGVWRFTMHGPDGADFPGKFVFIEVVPPEKLGFLHDDAASGRPPFHVTISFVEAGGKTRISLSLRFDNETDYQQMIEMGAVEGFNSTLDSLGEFLAQTEEIAPTMARKIAEDSMQVQPYLMFNGRCEEAAEFYREHLGAQITMMVRFGETPPSQMQIPPGWENKIMHLSLNLGATTVMMADAIGEGAPDFAGFSLSLTVPTEAQAERYFARLSEGGEVKMPLAPTFWASQFAMLTDRFGVEWMITVVRENE